MDQNTGADKIEIVLTRRDLTFFFSLMIVIGLFTINGFRALTSIGIVALIANTLVDIDKPWHPSIIKHKKSVLLPFVLVYRFLKEILLFGLVLNLRRFLQQKVFLAFSIIYLLHLASVFYTDHENTDELLRHLELKSALFLVPFAYCSLPRLTKKQYYSLFGTFLTLLFITGLIAIFRYIKDYDAYNEAMTRSKNFPVVVNHVRYSLMMAFGAVIGFIFFRKRYYVFSEKERYVYLALSLFCVGFLHLASVRSGLLCFYAIAGIGILYLIIKRGNFLRGAIILTGIVLIPVIAYVALPTVKNKVKNTIEDFRRLDVAVSANYYSLSARIFSYKVAWNVFKQHPVAGTGIGDLWWEVRKKYVQKWTSINKPLKPHNQFLHYLAAFGLVGFLIFVGSFYFPLIHRKNYKKDLILLIQYAIVSISFMFEGTLETQLGLHYSLLFIGLPLNQLKEAD